MTAKKPDANRVKRWAVRVHTMLLDVPPGKKLGIVKAELAKLPLEERGLAQQVFELGRDVARASLEADGKKTRHWFAGGITLITALGGTGFVSGWFGIAQRCPPGKVEECPAAVPSAQTCNADGRGYGPCTPKKSEKTTAGGAGAEHGGRDAGPEQAARDAGP